MKKHVPISQLKKQVEAGNDRIRKLIEDEFYRNVSAHMVQVMTEIGKHLPDFDQFESHVMGSPLFRNDEFTFTVHEEGFDPDTTSSDLYDVFLRLCEIDIWGKSAFERWYYAADIRKLPWFPAMERFVALWNLINGCPKDAHAYNYNDPAFTITKVAGKWVFKV